MKTLSIIVPVYNECSTIVTLLDRVLSVPLPAGLEKEVILVEGNSNDGTRELVGHYECTPGIQIIYEDAPRGKGAAVRRGLPPGGEVPPLVLSRPLPATTGLQRANIDHLELISDYSTAVEIGSSMVVRFQYQDRDSGVTINWRDRCVAGGSDISLRWVS